jgi:GT2 family glycosyltransferase
MMLMEEPTKVLMVVVHYKAHDGVLELLDSLQRLKGFCDLDLVIVDNCSGEEQLSTIRRAVTQVPNAEVLESSINRGYFGAAKYAFDLHLGKGHDLPDWIIVCNHDVFIEDKDFFLKLFNQDSAVGVIAPRIQAVPTKIDQNPFMRRRPGWWRRFTMRLYSAAYPLAVTWDWLSRQKRVLISRIPPWISRSQRNSGRQTIYAAHGSFMIFSRKYFEAGGTLDDQLFLFGEEIVVAESCRMLGLRVIFDSALSVLHNEHQSVGNGMSRRMFGYHREAVRHVLSKYLVS